MIDSKIKYVVSYKLVLISLVFLIINSCGIKEEKTIKNVLSRQENEKLFKQTLVKHLNAVTNKDLIALKSTMSPKGNMQLILPDTEILYSVDEFMKFHTNWFKNQNWTFETKILNTKVVDELGIAIVEIVYREPDRNGKPYSNRMIISYALEKIEGNWYIVKDHASSVEKSTD